MAFTILGVPVKLFKLNTLLVSPACSTSSTYQAMVSFTMLVTVAVMVAAAGVTRPVFFATIKV